MLAEAACARCSRRRFASGRCADAGGPHNLASLRGPVLQPLLYGKDIHCASLRDLGIFSRKNEVQRSLHAGGVDAPARLDRNILLAVDRKRYWHAIDPR